jgi:hypothetical protein
MFRHPVCAIAAGLAMASARRADSDRLIGSAEGGCPMEEPASVGKPVDNVGIGYQLQRDDGGGPVIVAVGIEFFMR